MGWGRGGVGVGVGQGWNIIHMWDHGTCTHAHMHTPNTVVPYPLIEYKQGCLTLICPITTVTNTNYLLLVFFVCSWSGLAPNGKVSA